MTARLRLITTAPPVRWSRIAAWSRCLAIACAVGVTRAGDAVAQEAQRDTSSDGAPVGAVCDAQRARAPGLSCSDSGRCLPSVPRDGDCVNDAQCANGLVCSAARGCQPSDVLVEDEARSRRAARPPADFSRLWLSIPLAAGLGFAGAVGGAMVGYNLGCSDESGACGALPNDSEVVTAALVGGLGLAVGAYVGGLRRDTKGSFAITLAGSYLGLLPVLLSLSDDDLTMPSLLLVPPIAAGLSNALARRPRAGSVRSQAAEPPSLVRLRLQAPLSLRPGLAGGVVYSPGGITSLGVVLAYRGEETNFVDAPSVEHSVLVSAVANARPNEDLELELGLSVMNYENASGRRETTAGPMLGVYARHGAWSFGPRVRVFDGFDIDDFAQFTLLLRYEWVL